MTIITSRDFYIEFLYVKTQDSAKIEPALYPSDISEKRSLGMLVMFSAW